MIPKPRYPKGSGASHNKKAPESSDAFWQGQKDSNPQHSVLETDALPIELLAYVTRD